MKRRIFIANIVQVLAGIQFFKDVFINDLPDQAETDDIKQYLSKILYTREEVDGWFEGKLFPFSKYHGEFGWLLNNNSFRDGVNNSWSVYSYRPPDGERSMSNYSDKPCRINTYGNSFTQCHQVSDNETWQEVLAAHLQEPVRNYGIGGWSAYQAYLRMLKEEQMHPAELIVFNFYDDDHLRNLDSWRNIRVKKHPQHIEATLPYLKIDIKNGIIKQLPNPCPKPELYYRLCDLEQAYLLFKDDFALKIMIAHEKSSTSNPAKHFRNLMELSRTHGIETRLDEGTTISEKADQVHREAAIFSSCKLVQMIEDFATRNNKKVLYVLSYPASYIASHYKSGLRWDQKFIDFLKVNNLDYIDLSLCHQKDFSAFKVDMDLYLARYFIGHYNPAGNFFCAQSIRDAVIDKLSPRPVPYLMNI